MLREISNLDEFWHRAKPLLESDPANNTVNLSIVSRLLREQVAGAQSGKPIERFFVLTNQTGATSAVAIVSSQDALVLSAHLAEDLFPLVDLLKATPRVANDLAGRAQNVRYLLEQTGAHYKIKFKLMLYQLRGAPTIGNAIGSHRLANMGDLEWLVHCFDAFIAETKIEPFKEITSKVVQKKIQANEVHMLINADQPVCMLGLTTLPARSARIGPVFTPHEYRSQGFAQRLVALVCQWQLNNDFCDLFLFTDANNPASNKCYQRVGFEYLCDHLHVVLEPQRS